MYPFRYTRLLVLYKLVQLYLGTPHFDTVNSERTGVKSLTGVNYSYPFFCILYICNIVFRYNC